MVHLTQPARHEHEIFEIFSLSSFTSTISTSILISYLLRFGGKAPVDNCDDCFHESSFGGKSTAVTRGSGLRGDQTNALDIYNLQPTIPPPSID